MLYLKVTFGKEIHLVTKKITYSELLTFIQQSFKNLPRNIALSYKDSDGDDITVCNEEDLETLYKTARERFVKVTVQEVEQDEIGEEVVEEKGENPGRREEEETREEANMSLEQNIFESDLFIGENHDTFEDAESITQPMQEPPQPQEPIPTVIPQPPKPQKPIQILQPLNPKPQPSFPPALIPGRCYQCPTINSLQDQLNKLVTEKFEVLLPCIINKVRQAIEGKQTIVVPKSEEKVVHKTVKCDGCGVFPIVGVRYKCCECFNFDLCDKCERTLDHPHNFVKIKKVCQECPKSFTKAQPAKLMPLNAVAKRAYKLCNRFGGQPETYRQFLQKNPDKDMSTLCSLYAASHPITLPESTLTKRCNKLSLVFRLPSESFIDFVKAHPEMSPWQLIKLKMEEAKEAEVETQTERIEVMEVNTETEKVEKKEEGVGIGEDKKMVEDNAVVGAKVEDKVVIEGLKLEEKKELAVVPELKVEMPKPESPKLQVIIPKPIAKPAQKPSNLLEKKEADYKAKKVVMDGLLSIVGDEQDYVDFVRKYYKLGLERCVDYWFDQH